VLEQGTLQARNTAELTMEQVRKAIGVKYF